MYKTRDDYQKIAARLHRFVTNNHTPGYSELLLDTNGVSGFCGLLEPLYCTIIAGGVIVHWPTDGDWCKALVIPEGNFWRSDDGYFDTVIEAVGWFFQGY